MLGIKGRSQTFKILNSNISKTDKVIWFHCASLGEYEQGLPVFEKIKSLYPSHKILLSFFSPSGYEIRKHSPIADVVVYLPLDTKLNARTFLNLSHPELVVFVKYEIWPNILNEIKQRKIRAILISALFREDQSLFKAHGKWIKKALTTFEHIFVQNESSKELLLTNGLNKVSVSGDTRFDRVSNQLHIDNTISVLKEFKQNKRCVVAGSTWPEGEKLLTRFINSDKSDTKYVIAPHNVKPNKVSELKQNLEVKTVLYTEIENQPLEDYKVLILDTIGLLSKAYSYADIAYVGGAVGTTGLHNTLEAAVFGVPIIIGENYTKFPEAKAMIAQGGMYAISNYDELNHTLTELIKDELKRKNSGTKNKQFVEKNKGAVVQIIDYLRI